ncbi:MAG: type II toxin-antitoxin system RelE/ParE family toxin [Verrucomicrobiota bacterium]
MATYKIEFRKSVEKELRSIPKKDQIRILQRISALANEPLSSGCKKLSGQERYRLRQGNYRILYGIEDDRLIITVVKVGDRGDVYHK